MNLIMRKDLDVDFISTAVCIDDNLALLSGCNYNYRYFENENARFTLSAQK
jgi:hypothetical protein